MDSELSQAGVRLKLGGIYLAGIIFSLFFGYTSYARQALLPAMVYFSFSLIWSVVIRRELLTPDSRKNMSIIFDQSIFAFNFFVVGNAFGIVLWAPIFATIGYGLRFGEIYAYRSVFTSTILIGLAMFLSPDWSAHYMMSLGIISGGIILPVYSIKLAETILRSKEEAEKIALQLEHSNRVDHLTGLFNKRGLEYQFNMCIIQKSSGVMMYIDLDGFKAVNDTLGHDVGDEVLREVADVLRKCVRSSDTIARLGGDEFVIMLTRLDDADAFDIGEKIIHAINVISGKWTGVHIGASIGAASFYANSVNDLRKLLAEVDSLMYHAKRSGKNKVWFPGANKKSDNGIEILAKSMINSVVEKVRVKDKDMFL